MTMTTEVQTTRSQDDQTWATLYARQLPHAERLGCRMFLDGLPQIGLSPNYLPDGQAVAARITQLTGWAIGDAQNDYLTADEWFEHLEARRFPVTNYIRGPHEIDFTPNPDLFHEYFGHLPFFANQRFADLAHAFGPLYRAANERQRLGIARLWWFTTEFGLVREGGELKAFGAGLLSSPAELARAFAPNTPRHNFDVRQAASTPSAVYEMHPHYFVMEAPEQIAAILHEYAAIEGLPVPTI